MSKKNEVQVELDGKTHVVKPTAVTVDGVPLGDLILAYQRENRRKPVLD